MQMDALRGGGPLRSWAFRVEILCQIHSLIGGSKTTLEIDKAQQQRMRSKRYWERRDVKYKLNLVEIGTARKG